MILGQSDAAVGQCLERAAAVEPGRSDETGDRPSADLLDEVASSDDAPRRLGPAETQELAFPGREIACHQPIRAAGMAGLVAMIIAMEEQLDPGVRPVAQPGCKLRAGNDRRF